MTHTLKMFNTGQVTLPKNWRSQFSTQIFIAEETPEGLLIKPLQTDKTSNETLQTVYYENEDGFGVYCEDGLDPDVFIQKIKQLQANG